MLNQDMLTAFVHVAESLRISRSADQLGTSKSVISKRIAQLEDHVGATLLSRSTRRLALTSAGEAYLEHAQRVLLELEAGQEHIHALRSELSGKLRLTAPVSWGERVLCPVLPEFLRLHPGVELELRLADRLMDVAFEGLDIALRWSGAAPEAGLHVRHLSPIHWHLVASADLWRHYPQPQHPGALQDIPCLSYWSTPQDDHWRFIRLDQQHDVRVASRYHVDNPEAVLHACIAGLGIALLPDYLCQKALLSGQLTAVLPGWTPHTRFGPGIAAVVASDRLRVSRNRALLDFLEHQFRSA